MSAVSSASADIGAKEYDRLWRQLSTDKGLAETGDDPRRLDDIASKIQAFLDRYPSSIPADFRVDAPFPDLTVREVYRRTIQTAIDILDDLSQALSMRPHVSGTTFRRNIVGIFTRRDRSMYVGLWLVFLSFVLYFIDSAA